MLAISDLFEFPIATGKRPRPFAPLSSNLLLFLDEEGGGGWRRRKFYQGGWLSWNARWKRRRRKETFLPQPRATKYIGCVPFSCMCVCVCVCVQGIEVSWEKYSNSSIFIRNWGEIIIDKCIWNKNENDLVLLHISFLFLLCWDMFDNDNTFLVNNNKKKKKKKKKWRNWSWSKEGCDTGRHASIAL